MKEKNKLILFFVIITLFIAVKIVNKLTYSDTTNTDDLITFDYTLLVDTENKIVKQINSNMHVLDLINKISVPNGSSVSVTNLNGQTKNNNSTINTGDKLVIEIDEETKYYDISVRGDANGDGEVNLTDLVQTRKHIVKWKNPQTNRIEEKSGIYLYAIDMNNDSEVSTVDLLRIKKIRVNAFENIFSIKLNRNEINLEPGRTATLEYVVFPANVSNQTITWESSDTSVATVNRNGKITAKSIGTAIITATTDNGKVATCEVTVGELTMTLSRTQLELIDESSKTLTATLSSSEIDQGITWESSDTSVATVSSSGKVKAKKTGTAIITAKSNYDSSVSSECVVTVRPAKYLFVGNSKTYFPGAQGDDNGIPKRFKSIAASGGYEIEYRQAIHGNYSLKQILDEAELVEIMKNDYDYVILQEGTTTSYDRKATYRNSVNTIKGFVEEKNSNVKIYLRKTWVRIDTDAETIQKAVDNTEEIANEIGAKTINDGPLFYDVLNNTDINIMKNQDGATTDMVHQNANGAYLAALCIYSEIYNKNPVDVTENYGINSSIVNELKRRTKEFCYDN